MNIYNKYIEVCRKATKSSEDNLTFQSFRRNPDYCNILEHVSPQLGLQYYEVIKNENPKLLEYIDKFKDNDKFGHPVTYNYPEIVDISPTTLRYIKVLSDLIEIYTNLDNLNIVEIGGGYGGQCLIISKLFNYKSYTILDMPEVVLLIQKYLKLHETNTNFNNVTATTLDQVSSEQSYDLLISNYAITEFTKNIQLPYLDKIVSKCTHGYITYNKFSEALTKDELISKINKPVNVIAEYPTSHPDNCIIYW